MSSMVYVHVYVHVWFTRACTQLCICILVAKDTIYNLYYTHTRMLETPRTQTQLKAYTRKNTNIIYSNGLTFASYL